MSWNFLALRKQPSGTNQVSKEGGFGLIELMVSISIMAIVSAVILARQSAFNSAVLLRGQTYEIALGVREVQLSAVSAATDGTGNFRSIRGIHFDSNALNNGQYKVFRDADSDGFYDSGEEFGIQGILDSRFEVRAIRGVGAAVSGNELSVIFVRPNFDARFFDSSASEVLASSVEIDVVRRGTAGVGPGEIRTLEITSTGQIAVQ